MRWNVEVCSVWTGIESRHQTSCIHKPLQRCKITCKTQNCIKQRLIFNDIWPKGFLRYKQVFYYLQEETWKALSWMSKCWGKQNDFQNRTHNFRLQRASSLNRELFHSGEIQLHRQSQPKRGRVQARLKRRHLPLRKKKLHLLELRRSNLKYVCVK